MASTSMQPLDLTPSPDLHPLYPTIPLLSEFLESHSGLSPDQKTELVRHSLYRAAVFADLSVIQFLLGDPQAQAFVDLGIRDEDGLGLVSLTIHGFGAETERDVEREECVRLLIAQGADLGPDDSGWTPLHHAALLSPPTLISHLMTHGCSPFDVTRRNLMPLDIVTAHSILPGRDDVALLLEETMRSEGWTGGKMEQNRRRLSERRKQKTRRRNVRNDVGRVLGVNPKWWGPDSSEDDTETEVDDEQEPEEDADESVYTPPLDYSSMLVFSPPSLPQIFNSLITNYQPSFRDATPANTLYMLARFACLTCDHTWLEDLIIGATDAIEETFFSRSEDVTSLVFWLYNTTVWLHLLQCDNSINEACEMLGSFELIEEVINSVFVFVIRYAERRTDQLLDAAILEYSSLGETFEPVQFESEWSFLRPFTGKKKITPSNTLRGPSASPPNPTSNGSLSTSPTHKGFSSLRQTFSRARASSTHSPLQSLFTDPAAPSASTNLLSFLTALHTLLTLSDINPAFITQLWSQVMYWTSCEIFNRVLTRKKYLCRSKAVQISANLGTLEEWISEMGIHRGVKVHFGPVRHLLNWLQCLSSITEFPTLVATIQKMKLMNPLQMRRAVRDYKYEVNEGRMTDECVQYLTQLQKDWERHRVKLGVEALRKEMNERDRDREDSIASFSPDVSAQASIISTASDTSTTPNNIDMLFDRGEDSASWTPAQPPQVLGELLDSRYMLPLLLPTDPRMLAVFPGKLVVPDDEPRPIPSPAPSDSRSASRASARSHSSMNWRSRNRKLREVGVATLKWIDGTPVTRWTRPLHDDDDDDGDPSSEDSKLEVETHIAPLTRRPVKGRPSLGDDQTTPVD
ncbi:DIL domain-containing protein [Mycena floridula]|nr:DIL domain-containing protein [Mycena floridula]